MTITLRLEHEKLIALAMQTGTYEDADEVIERALRMLHSEEEWLADHQAEIADKIDPAFAR